MTKIRFFLLHAACIWVSKQLLSQSCLHSFLMTSLPFAATRQGELSFLQTLMSIQHWLLMTVSVWEYIYIERDQIRLDNFFLSHCGNARDIRIAFSRESEKSQCAATQLGFFPLLYAMFSCFHTTGCEAYSVTTDGYRIFNVRTNQGACRIRKKGGQAQTSLHKS